MFTFNGALENLKSTREADRVLDKMAIERVIFGAHGWDSPEHIAKLYKFYSSIEDWSDFHTHEDCSNAFYDSLI